MSRLTLYFGVLLMGIGIYFFIATGSTHPTSLIATWFGVALILFGILAGSSDAAKRKLYMHVAVTIGLLGFLFPGFISIKELVKSHTDQIPLAHPSATHEQLLMAILCLIYVGLCVRSFIAARRSGLV